MLNTLKKSLFVTLFMLCGSAYAELPQDYKVVLLTENFPPFNMAVDDKNFARDDGIDGISADIVREMFKLGELAAVLNDKGVAVAAS